MLVLCLLFVVHAQCGIVNDSSLKTPLLCENRPPKSMSFRIRWPILLCCRTSMCNQDDLRLPQLTQMAPDIHQGTK